MEFEPGQPIHLPALPDTLPATSLYLTCDQPPIVEPGQSIQPGQLLTESSQPQFRHITASSHSQVKDIHHRKQTKPDGLTTNTYHISLEPTMKRTATALDITPPPGRDPNQWLQAMHKIGGWTTPAGLPGLMAQLHAAPTIHPETLVCIGVDQFAPFPDRSSLLVSFAEEAVLGTQLLADVIGAENVVMIVSKNAQVFSRVRRVCQSYRMKLVTAPLLYPSADPTILANHCLPKQRRIQPRSNPINEGVVMIDPWTAIRIGRWFNQHKITLARPTLIAWPERSATLTPCYTFPGQPLETLDQRLADTVRQGGRILAGHPMTGYSLWSQEHSPSNASPVVPDDQLLISVLPPARNPQPEPCINCGWCHEVCPTQLQPANLFRTYDKNHDHPKLSEQLNWCIDCGLCSHVCPSSLPLAQTFRQVF